MDDDISKMSKKELNEYWLKKNGEDRKKRIVDSKVDNSISFSGNGKDK